MQLARYSFGDETEKPTMLFAHGLFGSHRNWGAVAKAFSTDRRVVTVDMRNHGASPWDASHSYVDLAEDLANVIDGAWDVVGHSMGGKAAMALALNHPEKVNKLAVIDIAPVSYVHSQTPNIHAMRAVDPATIGKRSAADAQMADAVPDAPTRNFLLQSLNLREERWMLNLDALEEQMDHLVGFPEGLSSWGGEALFLSGAESDYVISAYRAAIKDHFPNARLAKIPGAGHLVHAEKPAEFEAAIRWFFDG